MITDYIIKKEGLVRFRNKSINEEFIKNESGSVLEFACIPFLKFYIKLYHTESYHNVQIHVLQGLRPNWDKSITVLSVESVSEFKIMPVNQALFDNEVNEILVEILTDFTKSAIAHNSGMFSVFSFQCGLIPVKMHQISTDDLKIKVRNKLQKLL